MYRLLKNSDINKKVKKPKKESIYSKSFSKPGVAQCFELEAELSCDRLLYLVVIY